MLLRVFIKRLPGGAPVTDRLMYTSIMYEADKINVSNKLDGVIDFLVSHKNTDPAEVHIDLDTHGYEILNDAGVVIERQVTAVTT